MMKPVLALDFDGVIADSLMECLFVGFNAYIHFNPGTKLFEGKKLTFENFEAITKKNQDAVNTYKVLRPYVIDAFCYYVIAHIIDNTIKIRDQDQYNKLRQKLKQNIHQDFIKIFYEQRKHLIETNFEKWMALIRPLDKIVDSIKKLRPKIMLAIATNNRKFTIEAFMKRFGIYPDIITDSSLSVDKKLQISHIKSKLNVKFEDIYFVDDQVKNFSDVFSSGTKCYLAGWGYTTQEQLEEAKKKGIKILGQDDFYKVFNSL